MQGSAPQGLALLLRERTGQPAHKPLRRHNTTRWEQEASGYLLILVLKTREIGYANAQLFQRIQPLLIRKDSRHPRKPTTQERASQPFAWDRQTSRIPRRWLVLSLIRRTPNETGTQNKLSTHCTGRFPVRRWHCNGDKSPKTKRLNPTPLQHTPVNSPSTHNR